MMGLVPVACTGKQCC